MMELAEWLYVPTLITLIVWLCITYLYIRKLRRDLRLRDREVAHLRGQMAKLTLTQTSPDP